MPVGVVAQKEKLRKRPAIAGADTNSAAAYYRHALAVLDSDPARAADALYWATRLEPRWPEALYARRVAELRSDQLRMLKYLRGDKRTAQSPQIREMDSLMIRALTLNPFLHRSLDAGLVWHFLIADFEEQLRRGNSSTDAENLAFYPAHSTLGNLALLARDTATAMREYGLAVELAPKESGPLLEYGALVLAAGDLAGADTALARLVGLEPWFAEPRLLLGDVVARLGRPEDARAHYQAFLSLAPRDDRRMNGARTKLVALGGTP